MQSQNVQCMKRCLLFYLLLCLSGCAKEAEEYAPSSPQVCDYVASLGALPDEEVAPETSQKHVMLTMVSFVDDVYKIGSGAAGYYSTDMSNVRKHALSKITNIIPQIGGGGAIYPGALVQGKSVREGCPVLIPLYDKRRRGRISLNVVSGDKGALSREIRSFTRSEVGDAMNEILSKYRSGFPAQTIVAYQTVHSLDEMAYYLGLDAATLQERFGEAYKRTATTKVMVKLSQVFFTMTYDQPDLRTFFAPSLSIDDIKRYCGPGNPPAYISAVAYGRYFVLLYESESVSEAVLESAIAHVYDNDAGATDITPLQRNIFKNKITNIAMLQIGGKAIDNPIEAITRDPDAIRNFIVHGAKFSADNVGEVVGYNVNYLATNRPLVAYRSLDTEYQTVEYRPVKDPNQIKLEIRAIRVEQIRRLRGFHGPLSYYSRCETSPIRITLYDEHNNRTLLGVFNPGIKATTHKNEIVRYYNYMVNTKELGITPKHRIVVEGSVKFRNKRLKRQDQTRTFTILAEFRYNADKEEWEVFYDGSRTPGQFGKIHIYKEFAGCTSEMSISYFFSTSFTQYPKNRVKPWL